MSVPRSDVTARARGARLLAGVGRLFNGAVVRHLAGDARPVLQAQRDRRARGGVVGDEQHLVVDGLDDPRPRRAGAPRAADRARRRRVLLRYGDVYGEVVNISSRLTGHACPDTVLVDRTMAEALTDDGRWRPRSLRPVAAKGYRHLQPLEFTRARP